MKSENCQNHFCRKEKMSVQRITVRLRRPKGHFDSAEISSVYLKHFCSEGMKSLCFYAPVKINSRKSAEVNVANNYWSSSTYVPNTANAWNVNFAADFRDRVVHRLIVDILEPRYENKFIADSYACRVGKGTHKAVEKLKQFIRSGTKNSNAPLYYLQLDIKGFFMQIHKPILYKILCREIKDKNLLSIVKTIIFHRPSEDFVFKGSVPAKGVLPPHKTLFHEDKDRGIPIGNLTSQFFANIYLNELDQFVKRNLGVKHYIRYVDDFILLSKNPEQLLEWKGKIIHFLAEHLKLELKDTEVQPESVYGGIDFLGYFVKSRYTLVRRRVFRNFQKTISEVLPRKNRSDTIYDKVTYLQELGDWRKLQSRINSYIAHFLHANSFSALMKLHEKLQPFHSIASINNKYIRIPKRLYHFSRFRNQLEYFKKQFLGKLLILPMGKFYEFYGEEVGEIAGHFNLKPYNRSGITTYGILKNHTNPGHGNPEITLNMILHYAKKNYISYVLFKQSREATERIKLRIPVASMSLIKPVQMEFKF